MIARTFQEQVRLFKILQLNMKNFRAQVLIVLIPRPETRHASSKNWATNITGAPLDVDTAEVKISVNETARVDGFEALTKTNCEMFDEVQPLSFLSTDGLVEDSMRVNI